MIQNLLAFVDVLKSIGGGVLAIVLFLVMIMIHEFGHYVAGKALGFKIMEFSIGFGPAIFKKRSKKSGELFAVRLIPLGGYCSFDGEDYEEEENGGNGEINRTEPFEELSVNELKTETTSVVEDVKKEESEPPMVEVKEEYPEPKGAKFNDQPPWKRIIVLIAGATMNYLLALLIIVTMFAAMGRPVYRVEKVAPEASASQGATDTYYEGLQTGDVVLKVDGKTVYLVNDWLDVLNGKKQGEIVPFTVLREGKEQVVNVELVEDAVVKNMSDNSALFFATGIAYRESVTDENGQSQIKVMRGGGLMTVTVREGFFQTIGHSFMYSFKMGGIILRSLGELLTGKIGLDSMGGPITTIKVTAEAASNGALSFMNIAALIGVNLAVVNLLPVPALDGCKVIFCLIEWIRKKPVNRKVETIIHFIGIIFLFGFAILVDLLQWF